MHAPNQHLPEICTSGRIDTPTEKQRQYAVAPVLGGVELLSAVYRSHRFSPHAQHAAVIGVVEQGNAMVFGAGQSLQLTKGDVLVIPPHVLHDAFSIGAEEWHYRALYLTTAQIAGLTAEVADGEGILGTRPFVLGGGNIAEQVIAVHDGLHVAAAHGTPAIFGDLCALIHALHAGAAGLRHEPGDDRRIAAGIARVRRMLDDDPLPKRSLSEMARLAHLSRFTFAHAFSRAYGVSPHAYAAQRRITAVRDLLMAGELVSRAAHHVGFADQSHLTRRFISVVGVTPGEFRRAWQQAQAGSSH
ncbi:MAG TPA: AraC family transcriptional regulator [Gemmatimonas sp.]|nr:AraC family transcriptional regulator [Gemmatimonas sp.]